MRTTRCSSCNARIVFVASALTGKPMPLDADAVENGNVVLREGRAHVITPGSVEEAQVRANGVPRFRSHFATCVDAAEHRRSR